MSLQTLIEGLAEARVAFVIVGMVAGQMYGSRMATYDLDVVYELTPGNIERIASYLGSVDAYVKETWPNEGVASEFSLAALQRERSITVGTCEGELDLLDRIDGIGMYHDVLAQSSPLTLENGYRANVITLTALILAKRASDRPKDRLHIVELETIADIEDGRAGNE